MAGRGAPTFLKRQKEMKRAERAQAKRQAKQARRESRSEAQANPDAVVEDAIFPESTEQDPAPDEASKD